MVVSTGIMNVVADPGTTAQLSPVDGGVLITFNQPVEIGGQFPNPIGISVSKAYLSPNGQICSNATSNLIPNSIIDPLATYLTNSAHPNFPNAIQTANTGLSLINAVGGPLAF
jgi:hypothetical protein